ncbi:MAG: MBL fold metallo-hydrolase [Methanospirillaceae archaeon]|nr:MBL fold metallo-hydrolase [Methanospirillaceae archaeon]
MKLILLKLFLLFCLSLSGAALPCYAAVTGDPAVHFIDVGEGDAILLTQDDAAMLIDAGPAGSADALVSYLRDVGIDALDAIIATHPDPDNIGGMASVISSFPVGTYYDNGSDDAGGLHSGIMDSVTDKGIPYKSVSGGSTIPFTADLPISVLSPVLLSGESGHDSLILTFTHGNTTFLVTGGADKAAEKKVSDFFRKKVTVMTVADHGDEAGTSEELLEEIKPDVAIIMAGIRNPDNHPHLATLRVLNEAGVREIYQTMHDGTIIITTDGIDYFVTKKPPLDTNTIKQDTDLASAKTTAEILFKKTGL